jgi:hypothetical protein
VLFSLEIAHGFNDIPGDACGQSRVKTPHSSVLPPRVIPCAPCVVVTEEEGVPTWG